jgi:Protein of unknown function (DUF2846)
MKNMSKRLIVGFVLALISVPPLHAQTAGSAPAASNASAGNTTPAGQAPDEVMKKLSDLVHAGKYAEAQQSVTALLILYPDDQRLIKAKALLDKALASSKPADPAASSNPPANNVAPAQPATNTNSEQLTGMDKVDYTALIELARQAQQNTDLEQQKTSLRQFMDQTSPFLQKHPGQMLLWQLRAASAMSLNQPMAGYEAAQQLLAAGAADSADANLQRLLAQLKNKGWLDKQNAEKLYEQQRYILVAFQGEAEDKPQNVNLRTKLAQDMSALLLDQYPARQILYTTPASGDPPPILTMTINVHDTTLFPCTYSAFKNVWKCPAKTALAVAASSPQGWKFDKTYTFTGGTSGVGWGVPRIPLNTDGLNSWISRGVIGVFRGILSADDVMAALLGNPTPKPAVLDIHSSVSAGNPTPEPAVPAVQNSAPISNSASLAPAPGSEPAIQSAALMNNSTPGHEVPGSRSGAPPDNPPPPPAASNTTVLHVYRPHHLTAAAQKPYIYIDGKKITPIANSQSIRMLLSPGKHNISVSKKYVDNEIPINNLDMAAGNEYWIRVDISAGAFGAHSKLYLVPTDQAQSESKRMEEIGIGDVSMN